MKNNDEWKEVWHVWDGKEEFSPFNAKKAICCCSVIIDDSIYLNSVSSVNDWFGRKPFIQAYTTGQMRRSVECEWCEDFNDEGLMCVACDGIGYLWEYKE